MTFLRFRHRRVLHLQPMRRQRGLRQHTRIVRMLLQGRLHWRRLRLWRYEPHHYKPGLELHPLYLPLSLSPHHSLSPSLSTPLSLYIYPPLSLSPLSLSLPSLPSLYPPPLSLYPPLPLSLSPTLSLPSSLPPSLPPSLSPLPHSLSPPSLPPSLPLSLPSLTLSPRSLCLSLSLSFFLRLVIPGSIQRPPLLNKTLKVSWRTNALIAILIPFLNDWRYIYYY